MSHTSESSVSTTSIVFDRIEERVAAKEAALDRGRDNDTLGADPNDDDLETGPFLGNDRPAQHANPKSHGMDRGMRRALLVAAGLLISAWAVGLLVYISTKAYQPASELAHDPLSLIHI